MNNPEFEPEMLKDIDVSGYSEQRADLQIDKKDDGNQGAKQFNRLTKGGTFIPPKKLKKEKLDSDGNIVFESK